MKKQGNNLFILISILTVSLASNFTIAEVVLSESFESGDMSSAEYEKFSWHGNNGTSIVTMDPDPKIIWVNGKTDERGDPGKDWTAYMGNNSLMFRYPSGAYWAEQRFSLNESFPEVWMSFWLRVPENFQHTSGNNKLFMIWMDEYSYKGLGSTVGMEFRPDGSGGSNYYLKVSQGNNNVLGRDLGSTSFIDSSSDLGKWINITFYAKAESIPGASDGEVRVWKRVEGETEDMLTHNERNLPITLPRDGSKPGFANGYLMGWANGAYDVDTEFLIDGFIISSESILGREPAPPSSFIRVNN